MNSAKNFSRPLRPLSALIAAGCLAWPLLSPPVFAMNDQITKPTISNTVEWQPAKIIGTPDGGDDWGLSPQEWLRYQQLMQGPRGIYSPGLDPLTALGIEARSADERLRYAELQVRAERQRVDKELAYQRAYDQAFARLYPEEKVIQISSAQSSSAATQPVLKSDGRLAVFIEENCTACVARVQDLQTKKQPFDLYFVGGQGDDERIRRWAILASIDPAGVRSRRITLNHDEGRWLGLRLGGDLPAIVREVNGKWQRQ
jgi:integrating conjugative element protein (TIGR03759 family)